MRIRALFVTLGCVALHSASALTTAVRSISSSPAPEPESEPDANNESSVVISSDDTGLPSTDDIKHFLDKLREKAQDNADLETLLEDFQLQSEELIDELSPEQLQDAFQAFLAEFMTGVHQFFDDPSVKDWESLFDGASADASLEDIWDAVTNPEWLTDGSMDWNGLNWIGALESGSVVMEKESSDEDSDGPIETPPEPSNSSFVAPPFATPAPTGQAMHTFGVSLLVGVAMVLTHFLV
ncbi:hypothetical protein Poli38472_010857 [Pythium oligandrum]|uniref:Uncharacterized protein n=1 Tax=Pythium oligandrum TaxID=41045 RepID=A0A8K1CE68_PYTOL|nr:hypothetical protein Poli38472_010857 [Pythium oligandrum]|eukprot:TMW61794.1 hypothetical protein Poli38472_010857 [Pythium oligandrum]